MKSRLGMALIALLGATLSVGCVWHRLTPQEARIDQAIVGQDWHGLVDMGQSYLAGVPNGMLGAFLVLEGCVHLGDLDGMGKAFKILHGVRASSPPDWQEVVAWARGLTDRHPDSASAWQVDADALRWAGKMEEAGKAAATAIRLAPEEWSVWETSALIHVDPKQATKCIAELDHVLELKPGDFIAYQWRSTCDGFLGRYETALADADKAVAAAPKQSEGYRVRGECYTSLHRYDEALADFDRATELDPDNGGAYLSRARVYMRQGKQDLALRDLDTLVALVPYEGGAHEARDSVLKEMKRK